MTVENVPNCKTKSQAKPIAINNGARLGLALNPRLGGLIPPSSPYGIRVQGRVQKLYQPMAYWNTLGSVRNRGVLSSPPIGSRSTPNTVQTQKRNIQPRVEINAPEKWERLFILILTRIRKGLQVHPGLKIIQTDGLSVN